MRIRRKPWARPELFACPFCINEEEKAAVAGHWQEQFAHPQPLWLELGCGKGQFMASLASSHPEINFIAIDIKSEVLVLAKRKIEAAYAKCQLPLDNIRILSQDIERISTLLLPRDQVERIYINFCNPWPTARHHKRRLTHTRQLLHYKHLLAPGGEIWFKTDNDDLYLATRRYFAEAGFTVFLDTKDLHGEPGVENILTEHEVRFTEQGIATKALRARLPEEHA